MQNLLEIQWILDPVPQFLIPSIPNELLLTVRDQHFTLLTHWLDGGSRDVLIAVIRDTGLTFQEGLDSKDGLIVHACKQIYSN